MTFSLLYIPRRLSSIEVLALLALNISWKVLPLYSLDLHGGVKCQCLDQIPSVFGSELTQGHNYDNMSQPINANSGHKKAFFVCFWHLIDEKPLKMAITDGLGSGLMC